MSKFNTNFCSPHVHQQSLDSGSGPESFLKRELELGTGALTVTDHGTLGACRKVYNLAKKNGLVPILGLEGYHRDDDDPILKKFGIPKDENGTYKNYLKYTHITLHCMDQKAFEALSRILSRTDINRGEWHGSEKKPIFNWADLEELSHYNITIGSSCLIGMVARHLFNGQKDIAEAYYVKLRNLFQGRFYVEVFPKECDTKWEDGVFIKLSDGKELKYYPGKKVITDKGELTALDLAKEFNKKSNEIKILEGVKNRNEVEEIKKEIISVIKVNDFIKNECSEDMPDGDVQLRANKFILHLAEKYGDKCIVSDDSHIAYPEDRVVQDIRLTNGITGQSWKFAGSYHRYTSDEAFVYLSNKLNITEKQFKEWIDNSIEWRDRFKNFQFNYKPSLPSSFYPENTIIHLKKLIEKHGRFNEKDPVYRQRLADEINLVHKNGTIDLLPYFFLAEELTGIYEEKEELTGPGRGSSGGLLINYLLGITHTDPIKTNLSKDRFLTLDRVKSGHLPDIDMDFPHRNLFINEKGGYLKERFNDCFAQISTNVMSRVRSSIKDVHRAVDGKVSFEIEEITKKIPMPPQGIGDTRFVFGFEDEDGHEHKGIIETDPTLKAYVKKYPKHWDVVEKMLHGLVRSKSVHASAFLIANEPVSNFIPITEIDGITTTQYTAEDVEANGGIKMDLLVVNSLNDIQKCIKLIQNKHGKPPEKYIKINGILVPSFRTVPGKNGFYDIWDLPESEFVFESILTGDNETVFQLNTSSAREWLKEFQFKKNNGKWGISTIEDISAFIALYRPGPLDAYTAEGLNMLQDYARRVKENDYEAGPLTGLLPETYNVMIYQEGLSYVYKYFTDCSNSEAEEFRSAAAKKKMEKLLAYRKLFIERASKRVGLKEAEHLWSTMESWASYGFNKSHSANYARISYACAYLKYFYPIEWWTAVLQNADKNEIEEKFVKYCGHWLLMPDINLSGDNFTIEGDLIRPPISILDGIGPVAHKILTENRPYKDIDDFCRKLYKGEKKGPNRTIVNNLILAGSMNSLFPQNTILLEKLEMFNKAYAFHKNKKKIEPVDEFYINVDPLQSFVLRKSIMPLLKENLTQLVLHQKSELFNKVENVNNKPIWTYLTKEGRPKMYQVVDVNGLIKRESDPVPPGGFSVCVPAYISSVRHFTFSGNKKACEINADCDGLKFKFVKWPDWGSNNFNIEENLEGSVCLILLYKSSEDKPFKLQNIIKIQGKI